MKNLGRATGRRGSAKGKSKSVCQVLPFPLARRCDLIGRQARHALSLKAEAGERHIDRQLQLQAETLRRRGVAEDLIAKEISQMRVAIRAAMWGALFDLPENA